ncbi:DMT family transporter [Roseovarius salinarum]|uniref:DMT family transporter n=1 Tax=Roseovarius salinarum TaxID=1981892 RepID=UPI000C31EDD7|nr:DMT family transporter [Roseovarius salinarum]
MEAWIILSVAAAAFQTLRFMLQKQLSMGALSALGATFARFAWSAPFAALLAGVALGATGAGLPRLSPAFWAHALGGGLAQILATWCVVALFARRNFAVGITLKKTEVLQTALVGFVLLGDRTGPAALAAIAGGLAGVLVLSRGPDSVARQGVFNRAAGLGLASGALFAVSAVGYRGATLEVASDLPLLRAVVTLAVVTAAQAMGMAFWLAWRDRAQLARVAAAARPGLAMGLCSLGGSLCWFTAFTLQNAALVFAVGQVEVIFSLAVSALVFRERTTLREMSGIALLTASIVALVLVA